MNTVKHKDSTRRFSDRVSDYTRYRPDYPAAAIEFLLDGLQLDFQSTIADVAAGTGILTRHLLKTGARVVAVEPNSEMRAQCDVLLDNGSNYRSVAATAEQTGLDNHSVDLLTAAQAFHWFDAGRARSECQRILKPGGSVVLMWNRRVSTDSGFLSDYEALLNTLPDYRRVNHAGVSDELIRHFLGGNMIKAEFPSHQHLSLSGLTGRLLSASYCPATGNSELMAQLRTIFNRHETAGNIRLDYRTQVYKTAC